MNTEKGLEKILRYLLKADMKKDTDRNMQENLKKAIIQMEQQIERTQEILAEAKKEINKYETMNFYLARAIGVVEIMIADDVKIQQIMREVCPPSTTTHFDDDD